MSHPRICTTKLAALRKAQGLTQAELGAKMSPPQSAVQVHRIESEDRRVTLTWLRRFAQALGVSVPELLAESDCVPGPQSHGGSSTTAPALPALPALEGALAKLRHQLVHELGHHQMREPTLHDVGQLALLGYQFCRLHRMWQQTEPFDFERLSEPA